MDLPYEKETPQNRALRESVGKLVGLMNEYGTRADEVSQYIIAEVAKNPEFEKIALTVILLKEKSPKMDQERKIRDHGVVSDEVAKQLEDICGWRPEEDASGWKPE